MGRLNPRVSFYWLWYTLAFGGICLVPCVRWGSGQVILAAAYVNAELFPWQRVLLVHGAVAFVLAVLTTVVQHVILVRRGARDETMPKTFSLRSMLVVIAMLGGIFGILRWLQAPLLVWGFILTIALGYLVSASLANWAERWLKLKQVEERQ